MNPSRQTLFLSLTLLALWGHHVFGQQREVTHRGEQWFQYNNITHLNEKSMLFGNAGVRWKDGFDTFSIFFGRLGGSCAITDNIRVATGFTYVEFYNEDHRYQVEYRPYEELFVRGNGDKLRLNHRFRFEQRFYNPVVEGKVQSDNIFALRLRYALMTGFDLFSLSKTRPDCKFRINISDEVMFNAGDHIVHNVFDKNRFIVMPTVQFNRWMSVSVGWNNQFASTTTAGHYIYTNALWVHFTHTLHLSKKTHGQDEEFTLPPANSNFQQASAD